MTVGEYEERFRRPVSSWHQILTATQSPIQARRRRWRSLVAAALLAVMTLFQGAANRHFRPAAEDPTGKIQKFVLRERAKGPAEDKNRV